MPETPPIDRASALRRWAVLCVVALCTAVFVVDWGGVPREVLRVGDVAERSVKAPFSFSWTDLASWDAARANGREAVPPVFTLDTSVALRTVDRVGQAFAAARDAMAAASPREQAAAARAATHTLALTLAVPQLEGDLKPLADAGFPVLAQDMIGRWIQAAYADRFVVADRAALPRAGAQLRLVSGQDARDLPVDERFLTPEELRERLTLAAIQDVRSATWGPSAEALGRALVAPNLTPDVARTESERSAAEAAIVPEPIVVQRGETLFREGDKLGPTEIARYEALQRGRTDHGPALQLASTMGFLLLIMATLSLGRRRGETEDEDTRELAAVGVLVVLTAFLARVVVAAAPGVADMVGHDMSPEAVWYMAPVAGGAMLVRILMGARRAMFYAAAAAAVCGLLMQLDALLVVYFLLVGVVAASRVDASQERLSILRAALVSGLIGALTVLVLHFVRMYQGDGELSLANTIGPLWSMSAAVIGGVLSGFLVLALVPLFELLGFVTDNRMLELASLNHPLLRQLMLRAPGTYHHSVIVGTLAEAGCEVIGANSLQAKIASYFHDIGKSQRPRYFVENQRGGANPHGELEPADSAAILVGHVVEGARMAREHKLPKPIIDNILMHHGTGIIQYFYDRARSQADQPSQVDETSYRYPGPKPNTREAGVIMLADKVEAATRTIRNPTEDNIRAMIQRIVTSVLNDHQFTNCPLTFQEIHAVNETFVKVLVGIHHQRIEYPDTASISQAPAVRPQPRQDDYEAVHNVVELDPVAMNPAARWHRDDLTDETTDYESLRNLPGGK